ncbi:MAG: multidrug efflux system membrane fusion protein [Parasphingorhabdus sp.]|jgi:multidrug efflux system membrane fusion protein
MRPLKTSSALQDALLVTILLITGISACSETEQEDNSAPQIIKAVKTHVIKGQTGSAVRVLSGTTISSDKQDLSFRVSGVIVELPIQVGDIVNKGDLIARLDSTDYEISSRQAQASVSQAKAAQVNAKSAYKRAKELYAAQAASLAELESARANADSAKASVAVAKQQLNSMLKSKQYTQLSSSTDNCTVTATPASINSNISAGSSVVNLSCGNFLRTKITVPEALIDQIKPGNPVAVAIPSARTESFPGVVVEVGVSNNNSAGFDVEIEIQKADKNLRVGLATSVTLQFETDNTNQVILLSPQAILEDASGKFVYVFQLTDSTEAFTAIRRTVATGELRNDGIEVSTGLSEGDEVIVSGTSRVNEGMKVKRLSGQ